jgi:hypothetical protein
MKDEQNSAAPDAGQSDEELEAEIDETLEDSFPASDAPSWTLGTDHQVESESEADEEE